jgi:flagellar hook-associated protein 3 FlgL
MRVSNSLATASMVHDLNTILENLDKQRTQVSTGKRITKPEDDPFGAQQALTIRSAIEASANQLSALNQGKEWLGATENALDGMTTLVRRAYTLAVRGANDSSTAQDRDAMAAQVDQMLAEAGQIANTRYLDQYIFAGFKTTTQPVAISPGPPTTWTYAGDSGQIYRRVESGETMAVNVTADTAFAGILDGLIGLRDELSNNDANAVRARLTGLDAALNETLNTQSSTGAKISRMEATGERLQTMQLALKDLLSRTEDVNMAEAVSRLTAQEYAYQVALQINARALSMSLLDFLQ